MIVRYYEKSVCPSIGRDNNTRKLRIARASTAWKIQAFARNVEVLLAFLR